MGRTILGVAVISLVITGCGREHHNLTPVAKQLDAYGNAHDLNGFSSLLTDDVVIKGPDGSMHTGKDSARAWMAPYLPGFHVESYGWDHAGDTLKWTSTVHSDAFARMGLNPMKLNTMAVFSGDKVRYFASAPTQETANKMRFLQFYAVVINGRQIDSIDDFLADDFVDHGFGPPNFPKGKAGVKVFFKMISEAFPDLHVTPNLTLDDGEYAFIAATWEGTNKGKFMGMPATNKAMTWTGGDVVRIVNGKATEHWGWDDMAARIAMAHGK